MAEAASSPLSPGVVIAETYEIERQLGRGGMGEVWLARHRRLAGKQVAIKVLHVDRQLPQEALARFRREAEIAARLEHPNIVQVLDFNTLPTGQPYLVMEYLKGQSLAARAQGRVLPLEQVTNIMRQVGAALQAAHHAGVVHRDLKPENIFLVPTALGDQVKVLDFGISKLADSNTVQTTDAVLIGTPLYMSPEQALGHNRDVTGQSDLFSLGSICFELLTGQAPFHADSVAKVVFRIAYEPPPSLAERAPHLPPAIIAAVEHALQKDRAARTASIERFVEELTGQPLATVTHDEASGVFTPGMQITDSMASGETRAQLATPATPSPSAPPAPTPAPMSSAPTVSGRKVMIALVLASLSVAGIVAKVRTDNWAERSAYRAGMIDAGWKLLEDGNLVRPDAGVGIDAGALDAAMAALDAGELDAGPAHAVDAGPVTARPVKPEVPPTPEEAKWLESLEAMVKAEKWDDAWSERNRMRLNLKTPSARERGLALLIETACARFDNPQLKMLIDEHRTVASGAQLRAAKQACLKRYPDAAALW
ncbi:MAG: serine/threonine-protein kinase [Myxococcota bacterium]